MFIIVHPNPDCPLLTPNPRNLKFQRNIRAKHRLILYANPSGPTSETHPTKDDCAKTWRSSKAPGFRRMNGICVSEPETLIQGPEDIDDGLRNQHKKHHLEVKYKN